MRILRVLYNKIRDFFPSASLASNAETHPVAAALPYSFPVVLRHLAVSVDQEGLSYLGEAALLDLAQAALSIENEKLPGIFIETGCALGGSSIVIAAAKAPERKLNCYDVFAMIPPPSCADGEDVHKRYATIVSGRSEGLKGNLYYGYQENLIKVVEDNFAREGFPLANNNISLIKGLYEDTLFVDEPVAFAHIDCDWYESVRLCLERIAPCLVSGGIMVIDDYYHYSGCRRAVDEFLTAQSGCYEQSHKNRLHLRKL